MLMWIFAVLLNHLKICHSMYIVQESEKLKKLSIMLHSIFNNTVKMFW